MIELIAQLVIAFVLGMALERYLARRRRKRADRLMTEQTAGIDRAVELLHRTTFRGPDK